MLSDPLTDIDTSFVGAPFGPVAPVAPIKPVGPVGPVEPTSDPVGPVGPENPVSEGPVGPVAPVAPPFPTGPLHRKEEFRVVHWLAVNMSRCFIVLNKDSESHRPNTMTKGS